MGFNLFLMSEVFQITLDFLKNPVTWKYAFLAIIPVSAYGYFFYHKSPRPRPKLLFLLTFLIGCFSVVPLLLYQYFYLHYLPKIELATLVESIALKPFLNGLISYFFHIGFITLLIFVIALLITLITTFFSPKTFRNIFRSILEENFNFQFIATIVGILVVIEVSIANFWSVNLFQGVLGVLILKAMMEEYSKHLLIRFTDDDQLFNIDDAIELSLFVGLAFAFVENILYFSHFSENIFILFMGRSLLTVLAHVVFSGIFGYYYGIAHFASPIYFEKNVVRGKKSCYLLCLSKIFRIKKNNLFRETMILNGLFMATLIHALFNFLLEWGYIQLAFLVVFGTAYLLLKLLKKKENYRQLGLIGTDVMPVEDFRNLTWQIDSLHWAKKIKKERMQREKVN